MFKMSKGKQALLPTMQGAALIVAPVLQATSSLFWEDGRYGAIGGTIVAIAATFWVTGLIGVLDQLRPKLPVFATIGLPLVIAGAISGANFGFQGFYDAALGVQPRESLDALSAYPVQAAVLLWWSGPLFPIMLLATGVALWRTGSAARWAAAAICLGGALFPLSRIPRIEAAAIAIDLLILAGFIHVGWRLLHHRRTVAGGQMPVASGQG
jgi:hypothetical protein